MTARIVEFIGLTILATVGFATLAFFGDLP